MVESYDIIGKLPIEISQIILMRVSPKDLGNVSKCCQRWKNIMRGCYFWKKKSEQDYNSAGSEYMESECYQKYVQNFSTRWQGHYIYNRELENNWNNGFCRKISVDGILNIGRFVFLDDDILIIVSKTREMCIINISNGLIEKIFQAKYLYRAVVEKSEGLLIALCYTINNHRRIISMNIKVWNLKTHEIMINFKHNLFIFFSKFWVYKHLIAFLIAGDDNKLFVFNIKKGCFDYERTLITGTMCFGNDTIALISGVNVIEIMDLNFNVLMKLTCCDDKIIHKIQMKNNYLFIECVQQNDFPGFRRTKRLICVWDLTTKAKLCTVEDGRFVDLTFINENKIFYLKSSSTEIWVECLSFPHFVTRRICIAETSSLQMWCLRTQKLIRNFDLKESNTIFCPYNFGHIDFLMVSNKNLAYVEMVDGKDIVHIMDF